nr:hypothetical protein [Cellulomonas sp. GbtcB1]
MSSRDPSASVASWSRASSSASSGVTSTATGASASGRTACTPNCAVRYQVPAGALAVCTVPAGSHSPVVGVIAHVRSAAVTLDAPRRFHSSSCVGCACGAHTVSRSTSSSMPSMTYGTATEPAA